MIPRVSERKAGPPCLVNWVAPDWSACWCALFPRLTAVRELVGIGGVVAALSVASDLTRGHPHGEAMRACLLATELARRTVLEEATQFLAGLGVDAGRLRVLGGVEGVSRLKAEGARADCEVGAVLAGCLRLPEAVGRAVLDAFERFDGCGVPAGRAGDEVAEAARWSTTSGGWPSRPTSGSGRARCARKTGSWCGCTRITRAGSW